MKCLLLLQNTKGSLAVLISLMAESIQLAAIVTLFHIKWQK